MNALAVVVSAEAPAAARASFTSMTRAQSVVCDLIRYLAAFAVVIHHAADFEYDRLYAPIRSSYFTNLGSLGVAVFFLLSGFLITYTVARKSQSGRYTLGEYLVERSVRIYIAFIPAILLAFAVVQAMVALQASVPPSPSRKYFLLTLAMMSGVRPILDHGQTYSMIAQAWTLNYEFFFYFIFGALCVAGTRLPPVLDVARRVLIIAVCAGLALRLDLVQLMVTNWLAGVAIALLFQHTRGGRAPGSGRWMIAAAVLGVLATLRMLGIPVAASANDIPYLGVAVLASLFFIALLSSSRSARVPVVQAIQLLAGFSYSMYLVHYAVMSLVRVLLMQNGFYDPAIEDGRKFAVFALLIVMSHVVAYGLYLGFEKHTNRVRGVALRVLGLAQGRAAPHRERVGQENPGVEGDTSS